MNSRVDSYNSSQPSDIAFETEAQTISKTEPRATAKAEPDRTTPISNQVLLDIQGLSHRYGKLDALKNLNYQIYSGAFNALLGANGAGKSTLFNLLAGLLKPQQGELRFCGQVIKRLNADYLANLGIVFQQSTLDLDLSVGQNLHYHASLHGMSRKQAKQRIEEELTRLNLLDRIKDPVRTLNGGHKRRVEIARALLHQPAFLMLDEATVGLDLSTRQQLTNYLHQRCQDEGLTVLWTTHLIEEIQPQDPVLILHKGEAKYSGLSSELIKEQGVTELKQLIQQLTKAE